MNHDPYPHAANNGFAVAGFVVSLVSLVSGTFGGVFLSPVGLGLSLYALKRPGQRGLAIAGAVLGGIGLLILILIVGFFAWIIGNWNTSSEGSEAEYVEIVEYAEEFPELEEHQELEDIVFTSEEASELNTAIPTRGDADSPESFTLSSLEAARKTMKKWIREGRAGDDHRRQAIVSSFPDAWHRGLRWSPGPNPAVVSSGPDRRFDSVDDIRLPLDD